jgi:hypothetical protein
MFLNKKVALKVQIWSNSIKFDWIWSLKSNLAFEFVIKNSKNKKNRMISNKFVQAYKHVILKNIIVKKGVNLELNMHIKHYKCDNFLTFLLGKIFLYRNWDIITIWPYTGYSYSLAALVIFRYYSLGLLSNVPKK